MLGLVPCTRVSVKHVGAIHVRVTLCLVWAVTSFNPMKNENDLSTTSALCDSLVVIAAQKHMKFVPARFCVLYEDDC